MAKIIDQILSNIGVDKRIKDGIFSIENNDHMGILREYFKKYLKNGISESTIIEYSNKIVEGKYPERQAFNADGILVTFPTPEYKADAIKAGTHFEKDPTKGMSNLFQDTGKSEKPPATPPPPAEDAPDDKPKSAPKTNLPVSQAAPPASDDTPAAPVQAQTTAAPQQTPIEPGDSPPPEADEPTELPPPPIKSPEEKEANKNAIKTMLKGDDYMLEMVTEWLINNSPPYLMDRIKKNVLLMDSDKNYE